MQKYLIKMVLGNRMNYEDIFEATSEEEAWNIAYNIAADYADMGFTSSNISVNLI